MALKQKDFVEVEYTAKLKDEDAVFDTTYKKVAEENELHPEVSGLGPKKICLGEGILLKGLELELVGKDVGEHTIDLPAEKGFGKKDAKLIQLIPTKKFKEQQINPMPGLQLNIDGVIGTIKTVSGGRTIVDFNPPLAGKDVIYDVKITRKIDDKKEQVEVIMDLMTTNIVNIGEMDIDIKEKSATISTENEVPKAIQEVAAKKIEELVGVKSTFKKKAAKKEDKPSKEAADTKTPAKKAEKPFEAKK